MSERAAELSSLKQEVAELWLRYRKDEPSLDDAGERQEWVGRLRALEARQRVVVERRSALRSALEAERRRLSVYAPALQWCGAVAGLVLSALAIGGVVPFIAEWSVGLEAAHGALAVGVSTLSLPFLLGSR